MSPLLGLLLGLTATGTTTNSSILARVACQIALSQRAQVTYIYRCVTCVGTNSSIHSALEQEIYRCVTSTLASATRSVEAHELEPLRSTDSMNIFHIPTAEAGEPLVRRILDMLNPRQPRRHLHKYIFVWPEASVEQLRQLFEGCWRKQLLFALAIRDDTDIYDFQPFGLTGLELITVDRPGNYFIDKLKNLRGFTLRFSSFTDQLRALPLTPVRTIGYGATDGCAARLLAKVLNATARYVEPKDQDAYGQCYKNGTITGVVRDLMLGNSELAINLRFVLKCFEPHVESLYPHRRTLLYLVVPAAQLRPEYLIFVTAFQRPVWLVLVANFLLALALFALIQRMLRRIRGGDVEPWYEIWEMLSKTHLGQPVERFSQISSMRCFLMGWILFSYVLTTIYFGKLESSFVQPSFEPQLDSLDGLKALGLKVHGVGNFFDTVKLSLSANQYKLLVERSQIHSLKESLNKYELAVVRRNKSSAFIMREDKAKAFLAATYSELEARPTYHIVKSYLQSLPATYIVPKGSPFLQKFQALYSAFYEHGLFEHWWRLDAMKRKRFSSHSDEFFENIDEQADLQAEDEAARDSEGRRKKRVVLTIDILQGAFFMWLIGILCSLLGFLLEHAYIQWKRFEMLPVL
ncbi:uncharacterized protein LOC108597887 [Drosophila busckii]|uniref:uncharacterized protein LOC108597887 n=1 Tax=Drosophila busckii TaxID=30019 RepID=UPI00083F46AF|nr:uncharacterized protein LOC108597887 [Drosophila busckii]